MTFDKHRRSVVLGSTHSLNCFVSQHQADRSFFLPSPFSPRINLPPPPLVPTCDGATSSLRPMGWATLTLSAALIRAMWCNVRLIGLLGWDNDHGKFAVFCGFCGLFLGAACAAMSPQYLFFFDLREVASELYRWGKDVAVFAGFGDSGTGEPTKFASEMFVHHEPRGRYAAGLIRQNHTLPRGLHIMEGIKYPMAHAI